MGPFALSVASEDSTEQTPLLLNVTNDIPSKNNRSRASSTVTAIWSPTTAPPTLTSDAGDHVPEPDHEQDEDDPLTKVEKGSDTASVRTVFRYGDGPHNADLEAATDCTSGAPVPPSSFTARPPRTARRSAQQSLLDRLGSCLGVNPRIVRGTLIASGITAALFTSAATGTLYLRSLSDLNGPKSLCKNGEWQSEDRWNCVTGVDTQRVPITSRMLKIDGHVIDFKPLGGASAGRLAHDSSEGRPSTVLFVNVEPEGHTDGDDREKGVCFISVNSENGVDQKDRINVQKCLFLPDKSPSGSSKPDQARAKWLHGWIPRYPVEVEEPYPPSANRTHLVCSPWSLFLHPDRSTLEYARTDCDTLAVREGNRDEFEKGDL